MQRRPHYGLDGRPHYGLDGWLIDGMFYVCAADGWISHTPTADAVCPVPDGIKFEALLVDGSVGGFSGFGLSPEPAWRVVAWRPVVQS